MQRQEENINNLTISKISNLTRYIWKILKMAKLYLRFFVSENCGFEKIV